ncbi:MAG: hypothetical protein Q4G51_00665 [Dermatophilus congolensis]|nr:hypothetical protein [Dermatophilus congolensis]
MADRRGGGKRTPARPPHRAGRFQAYRADIAKAWARIVDVPRIRQDIRSVRRTLPDRWRSTWQRLAPDSSKILRLTAAAVIAYVIVGLVFPGLRDLTGPLTALLVVQASLVQTFSNGLGRIAAVLTGVLIATILASVTGLTWWSLGLAIGSALALAHLMNLGDHVLETPISAMLILGVSSPETAAETRVAMTLIGAAVGVGFTLLLPPPVLTAGVPEAVRDVSDRSAEAVRRVASELPAGATPGRFDVWIRGVHRALPLVASADALITDAENRRRFNPRAIGRDEPIPVLRAGLASLDRIILALRHTLMSLQARYPVDDARGKPDDGLLGVLAVVFTGIADAIDSYGRFVWADASGRAQEAAEAEAACELHVEETRAMLTELALAAPDAASRWLVDPTVLSGLESVLTEMSSERRNRRLADWQARQAAAGVFSPPLVLDRPWLTRARTRRLGADAPAGRTTASGRPGSEQIGPPTLSISYREGLAAPAPAKDPPPKRTPGSSDKP